MTSLADDLFIYYQPPKHYFTLDQSFSLSRRLEKIVNKKLKLASPLFHKDAYSYAVYRAAMTLYEEENNWDDSCGVMGELFQTWLKKILDITPQSAEIDPKIFLKDLLLFCCWEEYGCVEEQWLKTYFSELSKGENEIGKAILQDAYNKSVQAFEDYEANNIKRIAQVIWPNWIEKPRLAIAGTPKEIKEIGD